MIKQTLNKTIVRDCNARLAQIANECKLNVTAYIKYNYDNNIIYFSGNTNDMLLMKGIIAGGNLISSARSFDNLSWDLNMIFPTLKDIALTLNALTKKREEKIDLSELEAAVSSR